MPTPILHTETAQSPSGVTLTLEVRQHFYAGHGTVDGQYRWTIYYENKYRPQVDYYHHCPTADQAISEGRARLAAVSVD